MEYYLPVSSNSFVASRKDLGLMFSGAIVVKKACLNKVFWLLEIFASVWLKGMPFAEFEAINSFWLSFMESMLLSRYGFYFLTIDLLLYYNFIK